jgi:Xaa-Pro aminopeptidase
MSSALPSQDASVFLARREALRAKLGNGAAMIVAGGYRARNYPANVHPYRADSHFLYLMGMGLPEAVLLVSSSGAELFLDPPADDDALWHGEVPSWPELATATGVDAVRAIDELDDALAKAGGPDLVGTLPSADPVTRLRQGRWLARPWAQTQGSPSLEGADGRIADAMIATRLVHDAAAIDQLKRAAEGTAAAHRAGMAATRPGILEHEVRAAMEGELLRHGQVTAYGSIVTVHGEILHNTTHDQRLEAGDLLLADVGAEHEGWAGDVTRTWPVTGKFSATQRALYDIVLQAELDAIDLVRSGTRYRDVHLTAARTLTRGLVDEGILIGEVDSLVERGAHALFFPHGVGHLLGLDVHDMEDLGDRAGYAPGRARSEQFGLGYLRLDRDLAPGMAVTIEPGFYLVPGILANEALCGPFDADGTLNREALDRFSDVRGIRIEDDVLCTEGDPLVLTAEIPKLPDEVEAAVGH